MAEFERFHSITRLSKEWMIIMEKIDGTNACIIIEYYYEADSPDTDNSIGVFEVDGVKYMVTVQSRNIFIVPGADNAGFAVWVTKNVLNLIKVLGEGRHYGEWWGGKIQRGYGLTEKRFSLFNTDFKDSVSYLFPHPLIPELRTVPVLYEGPFDITQVDKALDGLRECSVAAPMFKGKAEGVVVFLKQARTRYKVLCYDDAFHKWELKKGLASVRVDSVS